jgi:uncharacterized protein
VTRSGVLVDTGPLVAALSTSDVHHRWAVEQMARLGRGHTCEAVIAEAAFLAERDGKAAVRVVEFVTRGALTVQPVLPDHAERVAVLMRKYADVPISLADACLVVLAEQQSDRQVFTLDTDFLVYRMHGRRRIPLIAPFA